MTKNFVNEIENSTSSNLKEFLSMGNSTSRGFINYLLDINSFDLENSEDLIEDFNKKKRKNIRRKNKYIIARVD